MRQVRHYYSTYPTGNGSTERLRVMLRFTQLVLGSDRAGFELGQYGFKQNFKPVFYCLSSFEKYVLSAYYMLNSVLNPEVNKIAYLILHGPKITRSCK